MYLGIFDEKQKIADEFQIDVAELEGCRVMFAAYTYEDYSGSAFVLFMKDGKLYEVNGSHCSCHGLEGQWTPEETFMEAIRMRDVASYGFSKNLEELFIDIVFEKEVLE